MFRESKSVYGMKIIREKIEKRFGEQNLKIKLKISKGEKLYKILSSNNIFRKNRK